MENVELLERLLDELKSLNHTQREINTTLKVLARHKIEKRLSHIFKDSDEIAIYQLSDGDRTTGDIVKLVSISKMTISRLWQKWEEIGIVETEGYRNPYHALYSLEELSLLLGKQTDLDHSQMDEVE